MVFSARLAEGGGCTPVFIPSIRDTSPSPPSAAKLARKTYLYSRILPLSTYFFLVPEIRSRMLLCFILTTCHRDRQRGWVGGGGARERVFLPAMVTGCDYIAGTTCGLFLSLILNYLLSIKEKILTF
jgi:hypothetical protein